MFSSSFSQSVSLSLLSLLIIFQRFDLYAEVLSGYFVIYANLVDRVQVNIIETVLLQDFYFFLHKSL